MNYSKHAIYQRQKKLSSKFRKVIYAFVVGLLCLSVIVFWVSAHFFSTKALDKYEEVLASAPGLDDINVVPNSYASTIYFNDGKTVAKSLAGSESNREYVYYNNISQNVINAFVALEDERFYSHFGVDPQSIIRAAVTDIIKGDDAGGSTITQQLIKNQVFKGGNESSIANKFKRKLQEQYLAISLERKVGSKDKILEYYLNTINLGNGSYGIEKASLSYFGKSASKLNISEAAVLAPIAYSPSLMNPLTHPEANKERRKATLDNMLRLEMISKTQYDDAIADTDNVYERIAMQDEQNDRNDEHVNSYFVDALIEQVLSDLEEAGYSSYDASQLLYSGGLTIYSTQDQIIQNVLNNEFNAESNFPKIGEGSYYELTSEWALSIYMGGDQWIHYHLSDLLDYYKDYKDENRDYIHHQTDKKYTGITALTVNKDDLSNKIDEFIAAMMTRNKGVSYMESARTFRPEPQAGMVIMEPGTGKVLALYGGRGKKLGDRVLNRATDTYRQPGSTFKILAAFLPALDTDLATLATVFDDSYYEIAITGDIKRAIQNWYSTGYEGLSSIRRGIYHSMNIVATKCLESVGINTAMSYLKQMGFSRLDDKEDRNVSLALGGLSEGVSVMELTSAYSMIANQGYYNAPKLYTEIYDHDGKLLLSKNDEPVQVIKPTTAFLLTNAMCDTVRVGTGTKCQFESMKMPIAGKTGTTNSDRDLWFCGYTPYYCAAIWSGFDNNYIQTNTTYQKELWRVCMEEIHKLKECEVIDFTRPEGIVAAKICSKCGKLAIENVCEHNEFGNLVTSEYFSESTVPTEKCTCCVEVLICEESGLLATQECLRTKKVVLLSKEETTDSLEHGGTFDTNYTLESINGKTCNLAHSKPSVTP